MTDECERASEREDGDGRKEDLPRTVGAGAPRWVPAGPCTDKMEKGTQHRTR